jgi:predicted ATPase
MRIKKVVVENYRCLRKTVVSLSPDLNILVGDNECGKSTLLEAINLTLTGQLSGRSIHTELHPYLFNTDTVAEYLKALNEGKCSAPPPSISIELYLADEPNLAKLKGTINSLREDTPGIKLSIEFNREYADEFKDYAAVPAAIQTLPVEYYAARWRSFADNDLSGRMIPIRPSFIDASTIRNNAAASRYLIDVLKDGLTKRHQVDLALSYRTMRGTFLQDERISAINKDLANKTGRVSDKTLSVNLDTSPRAGWETSVAPHLDDIPLLLVGKGEQNCVKIKLALEDSSDAHIVLIEEPENHLSYSRLNELIGQITERRKSRQLIISTHSSFVLNKLGVHSVILFNREHAATLRNLDQSTQDYFIKLPGHDTLRLMLSKRVILVEGPSDELIVQRAFVMKHKNTPLQSGVDVLTVGSLAFKRFLAIAKLLNREVDVVTDNDGDIAALNAKYVDYATCPTIRIHYDSDVTCPTLEPQLLRSNGLSVLNQILETSFATESNLLKYMSNNKTECALRLFETDISWIVPDYICHAVR